jgi:hypothetical protein
MQVKKIVMNSGRSKDAPVKLKTRYVFNGEIVKTNHGSDLFEAGLNVMRNLQINKYGATYAEVLDAETDQLYYSQSRSINGVISKPHYEWNPEDTVIKFGATMLLEKKRK